jgi:hypothetical protein
MIRAFLNPFAFFLAIADKVHTALNLLGPTRTYAAADALWEEQRGAGRLAEREAGEEVGEPARCGSQYQSPNEDEDDKCICSKALGHSGRHVCTCDERWADEADDDETDTTAEEFGAMWDSAKPATTKVFRDRMVEIIWQELTRGDGTSSGCLPDWINRAADAIWHEHTCRRCGFGIADLGVYENRCNDCAPRLQANASAAPASQTDAPGEASGVPEGVSTPDPDAPSGHLTLGNDPQRVHERALRQRTNEDRNPQRKGNAHA